MTDGELIKELLKAKEQLIKDLEIMEQREYALQKRVRELEKLTLDLYMDLLGKKKS